MTSWRTANNRRRRNRARPLRNLWSGDYLRRIAEGYVDLFRADLFRDEMIEFDKIDRGRALLAPFIDTSFYAALPKRVDIPLVSIDVTNLQRGITEVTKALLLDGEVMIELNGARAHAATKARADLIERDCLKAIYGTTENDNAD